MAASTEDEMVGLEVVSPEEKSGDGLGKEPLSDDSRLHDLALTQY